MTEAPLGNSNGSHPDLLFPSYELSRFLDGLQDFPWYTPNPQTSHELLQAQIDQHYVSGNEQPIPIRIVDRNYRLPDSNGVNSTGRNTSYGLSIGLHLVYARNTREKTEAAARAAAVADSLNLDSLAVAAFGDTQLGKIIGTITRLHIIQCAQWIADQEQMRERGFAKNPIEPIMQVHRLGYYSAGAHVPRPGKIEHLIFKPRTK